MARRMRGALCVMVLATGCGRLGFDALGDAVDASSDGTTDSDPSIDATVGCVNPPNNYNFVVGTSHYRLGGADNWLNGELDCQTDGAGMHYARIENATELTALMPLVGGTRVWVGISDRITEGSFLWVTGTVATFTPWEAGSPVLGGQDCVSWDPVNNDYRDESCNGNLSRICECDGIAIDTAAF